MIRSSLPQIFCAGSDLRELAGDHELPGVALERTRFEFDMWQRLSGLPQPSIAAIDGHALGSGLELAVACDFRIAGARATLGLPEIHIGGAPGIQVLARLPVLVGLGIATRMLLSGDALTAEEAASAGLVHEVTADGAAFEVAERLALRLAGQPRSSVRFLKAALGGTLDASVDRVASVADDGVEGLFQAPEMREGSRPSSRSGSLISHRSPLARDGGTVVSASKVVDVAEAVARIEAGQTLAVGGSGHLLQVPDGVLAGLAARYDETGSPSGLTVVHAMGIGDNAIRGMGRLAPPGLVRRFIGSHYGHNPEIMRMIADDEVEALASRRDAVAPVPGDRRPSAGARHEGRPGDLRRSSSGRRAAERTHQRFDRGGHRAGRSRVALLPVIPDPCRTHPCDDSRHHRQSDHGGRGGLCRQPCAGIGGAQLRGGRDRRGQAAGRGWLASAQVRQGPRHPRRRHRRRSRPTPDGSHVYSPYLAGTLRAPGATIAQFAQGPRKLIARRAAEELTPGDIVNLGYGVSSGVASVLAEEGCYDRISSSIEQGMVGGVPGVGLDSGTAVNAEAYIDEGSQFELYDGGTLDVACVAFGEVDAVGNVNVSKLAGRGSAPAASSTSRRTPRRSCSAARSPAEAWKSPSTTIGSRSEGGPLHEVRRAGRAHHLLGRYKAGGRAARSFTSPNARCSASSVAASS